MRLRSRGQEDRKASRRHLAPRRREMLIRKASKRHREMPEIGPDHSAVAAIPDLSETGR